MSIEFVVGFFIGYVGLCSAVIWFSRLLRRTIRTRGRLELRLLPQMRSETMTLEERQALREKHSMRYEGYEGPHVCRGCGNHRARVPYPCDAIKILDELDRVMNAAEIYGLTVKAMTEINTAELYETRITKALAELDHINTMRVDEDDFEYLESAINILRGEQ